MATEHLPILMVFLPLLGGLAAFVAPPRQVWALLCVVFAGVAASLAPLYQHLVAHGPLRYPLGGWGVPLGIDLYVDGTGLVMLGMTTGLMAGIAFYSWSYFGQGARASRFWPLLLLTWAGLNNLFVTADIFNMYVTLELLGLLSVGLIALAGTPAAYAAAMRYLLAALAASLFYLLGVAMVYHNSGNLDWVTLRFHLAGGPSAAIALGLMTAGLMLKSAVFPLHFWLPPAHANAPAPVSALLSALMIKASFYIALRMWLWVFPGSIELESAAPFLGVLGAAAIVYGSVQALRQPRLKLLVAYSTVAQLGYLFVFFALSMRPGGVALALQAVVFFAVSHAFAKAALFMCSGAIIRAYGHDWIDGLRGSAERLPGVLFAFGIAGVSIMGLPPSGGFVGKYLLIGVAIGQRQWFWAAVLAAGGLLAAAYIFRVLNTALSSGNQAAGAGSVARGLVWPAWGLAMVALLLGLLAYRPLEVIAIGAPDFEALRVVSGGGP